MNIECETCETEQFIYDKFLLGFWDTKTLKSNIFVSYRLKDRAGDKNTKKDKYNNDQVRNKSK